MEGIKKYSPWTIRSVISFLFLLSAVAKLYPSPYFAISTFEFNQLYPMGFSEEFAPYFSRILIGIELALGILIMQPNFLKRLVIPGTMFMLVVFTTHLTIETIQNGGNEGNCGCFGSLLPMTPIQAILKNLAALALLTYLITILPKKKETNQNFWVISSVTFAAILALFMLAPMQPVSAAIPLEPITSPIENLLPEATDTIAKVMKTDTIKPEKVSELKATIKTEPAKHKSGFAPYFSTIDSGKKILCFFAPGCDHCQGVAKELTEMKQQVKNFPEINIIFMNEEIDLIPSFFKIAGAEYPYKILEIIPFYKVIGMGKSTPGVKYLWNGNEYVFYYGIENNKFNKDDFKALIQKPFSELKK